MGNPFTLTFGKKPSEYIIRRADIEEIEIRKIMSENYEYWSYQIDLADSIEKKGNNLLLRYYANNFIGEPLNAMIELISAEKIYIKI